MFSIGVLSYGFASQSLDCPEINGLFSVSHLLTLTTLGPLHLGATRPFARFGTQFRLLGPFAAGKARGTLRFSRLQVPKN